MTTEHWTTVFPIPWRDTSFTYIPYWIMDIIRNSQSEDADWRDFTDHQYQNILDTLQEAYEQYGDVSFIESKNGTFGKLSAYTNAVDPDPVPRITVLSTDNSFPVGAHVDCPSFFEFLPQDAKDSAQYIVSDPDVGTIGSDGIMIANAPGTVTVTAIVGHTSGPVTASVDITIYDHIPG